MESKEERSEKGESEEEESEEKESAEEQLLSNTSTSQVKSGSRPQENSNNAGKKYIVCNL